MGVVFKQYLSGDKIYTCCSCGTHAADHQELVSKVRVFDSCPRTCEEVEYVIEVGVACAGFPRKTWKGILVY